MAAAEGGVLDALREQPWAIDELNEYGNTPILLAVLNNNLEGLQQLIAAKADINRRNTFGNTLLTVAAHAGNDTMVQKLLGYIECRRLIGQTNFEGQTALHFAVESGSTACVRLLLGAGESVSKPDQYGSAPIHRLAGIKQPDQQGIKEMIKLLQAHGADIESKDAYGQTPALYACGKGNVPVLRALVSASASLRAIGSKRRNILHLAAYSDNLEVVSYLAAQDLDDIDPQLREINHGKTPLGRLTWVFDGSLKPLKTFPSPDQQQGFIKLHFDLLIRNLERHMSTLKSVRQAVEHKDAPATTKLLDVLINRSEARFRKRLVGWYRGLQFYVSDGQWGNLTEAICEEYDETSEKMKRAAVARGKTLGEPEMREFF